MLAGASVDEYPVRGPTPARLPRRNNMPAASRLQMGALSMGFLRDRIRGLVGSRSAHSGTPPFDERDAPSDEWNERLLSGVESGNLQLVVVALAKGADVNCTTADGWTPLLSASKDRLDIVRHLLAAKADPNVATPHGYTALMRAAGHDAVEIVKLLIAAGADLHARDEQGLSARDMAMLKANFDAADVIGAAVCDALVGLGRPVIPIGSSATMFGVPYLLLKSRVAPGRNRVRAKLSDGTELDDARVYDTVVLEVAPEHVGKAIVNLAISDR